MLHTEIMDSSEKSKEDEFIFGKTSNIVVADSKRKISAMSVCSYLSSPV